MAEISGVLPEPYAEVVRVFSERWSAAIIGGAVRDFLYTGLEPRDLDLVVQGATVDDLLSVFPKLGTRRNAYDGVKGTLQNIVVDVWPLDKTLAFKEDTSLEPCFENLVRTTFFNIEAALLVFNKGETKPWLIDYGMQKGMERSVLEVSFEPNPYPLACVVRAAIFAHRFGLHFGPRLAQYVVEHPFEPKQLDRFKQSHYKGVYDSVDIHKILAESGA